LVNFARQKKQVAIDVLKIIALRPLQTVAKHQESISNHMAWNS
jgi:hypothetical protein